MSFRFSVCVAFTSLAIGTLACDVGSRPAERPTTTSAASLAEDRRSVEAAVRRHWTAINRGDTATIAAQHTGDLTIFMAQFPNRYTVGTPGMDSLAASLRSVRPQYVVEGLEVQQYGDIAVATFYMSGGVRLADGRLDDRRRRMTEVWVRQPDGTWKEAHHHDSVVSKL